MSGRNMLIFSPSGTAKKRDREEETHVNHVILALTSTRARGEDAHGDGSRARARSRRGEIFRKSAWDGFIDRGRLDTPAVL